MSFDTYFVRSDVGWHCSWFICYELFSICISKSFVAIFICNFRFVLSRWTFYIFIEPLCSTNCASSTVAKNNNRSSFRKWTIQLTSSMFLSGQWEAQWLLCHFSLNFLLLMIFVHYFSHLMVFFVWSYVIVPGFGTSVCIWHVILHVCLVYIMSAILHHISCQLNCNYFCYQSLLCGMLFLLYNRWVSALKVVFATFLLLVCF